LAARLRMDEILRLRLGMTEKPSAQDEDSGVPLVGGGTFPLSSAHLR
jgi:hypothetical protein